MIPLILLAPLALAGGGAIGFAHERFHRKQQAKQASSEQDADESADPNALEMDQETPAMTKGDLTQVKYSERAAQIGLGVSVAGALLSNPAVTFVSLPFIGYSIYNWLKTQYKFEQPWLKSPLRILATLALLSSLALGNLVMASLVLIVDLGARKWIANWTKDVQFLETDDTQHVNDVESDAENSQALEQKWYSSILPASFVQKIKLGLKLMLEGEPRWEWFPHLLARVSMGLFFAISGFNKLFTAAHWKPLVGAMVSIGLPFPKFMALFLASVEFYGGSLLTIGFLSTVWAIALSIAMVVAIVTVEIPTIIPPGLGPLDWLDWFLYLPQVLYVLIFLWLIVKGPGPYSVDAIIANKLALDDDSKNALEDKTESKIEDTTDSEPEKEKDEDGKPVIDLVPPQSGGASWTPA